MFIDSCYECESLNIDYRFLEEDDDTIIYEVICRGCGNCWVEEEDK